jgi:hypothetical protein
MHSATAIGLARLAAIRKARAHLDGQEAAILADLAALPDAAGKEWIREDVAVAMHLPPMTAHKRLHGAAELQRRLPDTVAAMQRGVLNRYFADKILDATEGMDDLTTGKVEARVLERAGTQTLTQFSRTLRRAVIANDRRDADDLADKAREQRHFEIRPCDHAMGDLRVHAPLEQLYAIRDKADALADDWKKNGDDRTADQRRVDALVHLCLGDPTNGGGVKAQVNITMPLATLLGVSDEAGDLDGEPLPAALARAMAADPSATWRRIVTDPVGQVLDVGRTSYEPTAAIRRHVTFRDPTCRFPGCGRRAKNCELDHVIDWDLGGPTADWNLAPLCPRHHHLKHETGWSIERTDDGWVRWFTPYGEIIDVAPDPPPA